MLNSKNALPIPELCDCCCSPNVQYTTNDIIYGRNYGEWPMTYFCTDCRAAVGCHPGTNIPLGQMADRKTRQLRKSAHNEFDKLWRTELMSRTKAYSWLALQLNIEVGNCHLSWLSKEQLKQVALICSKYLAEYHESLIKRKVKQNAKQTKRETRANAAFERYAEERRKHKIKRRT